jgi:hypothetical protein
MVATQYIYYAACPDCGAPFEVVRRKVTGGVLLTHINGGIWESVQFACGREDAYVPNFCKIITERPCSRTPVALERRAKRKADLDEEVRKKVFHQLRMVL